MKTLLVSASVVLIFIVSGCTSKESVLESKAKEFVENTAFKDNASVKIIKFNIINYEMVSEKVLDTIKLIALGREFDKLNEEFDEKMKKNKIYIETANAMEQLGGDTTLSSSYKSDAHNGLNEARELMDKMNNITKQDSIIKNKIKNTNDDKNLYKAKFYIKSVLQNNNTNIPNLNFEDTLIYFFDKNLKMIEAETN